MDCRSEEDTHVSSELDHVVNAQKYTTLKLGEGGRPESQTPESQTKIIEIEFPDYSSRL